MDIQLFNAFVGVAEAGSFSLAAENLHLTQPAVSKRIAALESSLGERLFDRIGRKTTLTEAGSTLLPYAHRVLWELEDGRRALSGLSDTVGGRLSLGASHHIGLHRMPDILREYARDYPNVELDPHFQDSEKACAAVEHGDIEFAIATLPPESRPRLRMLEVWPDPMDIVVASDHPLTRQANLSTLELTRYPAILPGEGTYTRALIDKALHQNHTVLGQTLVTNYMETIRCLVQIGLGWSVLPRTMMDSQLVKLNLPMPEITRRLGVVWHAQRSLSNAAKAMLDRLQQQAMDGG